MQKCLCSPVCFRNDSWTYLFFFIKLLLRWRLITSQHTLLPASSALGVFVVCIMAGACGRGGGEKVTSISSFKCGLFFWKWRPWRKMYLASVRLRLPAGYVAWRWQKDGNYQQDEAPFCSVPHSQVNNCRTSRQTKELAQLMTLGRWESCQHKTTREWSCLSGS